MHFLISAFFAVIALFLIVNTSYYDEPDDEDEMAHVSVKEIKMLQRALDHANINWSRISELANKGVLKCKEKAAPCGGIIPCCGTMQCYWDKGYSMIKKGVCVDCVEQGQICQRDMQCCSGFVCQKERVFHINGICDVKRATGSNCHDTDQCVSNRCNFTGWQWARFQEGKCL